MPLIDSSVDESFQKSKQEDVEMKDETEINKNHSPSNAYNPKTNEQIMQEKMNEDITPRKSDIIMPSSK